MANIKPLVYRTVILDCEPLAFTTDATSAFGQHSKPRLFCDSCTIFGVEIPKALFAVDGGQQMNDVTSPTAACTLTEFHLCGPDMAAELSFTIRCPVDPDLRTKLQDAIRDVRLGKAAESFIKFGQWNTNQEYKDDKVWAPAMQPAEGMVLTPVSNAGFQLDIGNGHFLGGSTVGRELAPITGYGFQIDRKSFDAPALDVVHAVSTEKGQYPLLSMDEISAS